jgi:DNA gyrase subunit A
MFTCKKSDMDRDDLYLTMVSHKGFIKKTSLSAFSNLRKVGIRALIIEEGDDLIDAALTGNASEILLSTEKGMACRFHSSEIRAMGRGARGVTGIRFKIEGDNVVSMVVVEGEPVIPAPEGAADESAEPAAGEPDVPETEREPAEGEDDDAIVEEGQEVIIISDKGMGKRSFVKSYRMTRRGARGVINIKLKGSEKVVAAIAIGKGDELLITTKNGQLVRIPTDEIRTKGRATMGVKVMNLDDGDSITGVTKVAGGGEEIPENAENTETAPDGGAPRDGTAQEPSSPDGGAPENT